MCVCAVVHIMHILNTVSAGRVGYLVKPSGINEESHVAKPKLGVAVKLQ